MFSFTQSEDHGRRKKEREDLGVELYGVQQELAKQQMVLEKDHDKLNEIEQLRKKTEVLQTEVKSKYNQIHQDCTQQQKKSNLFSFFFK